MLAHPRRIDGLFRIIVGNLSEYFQTLLLWSNVSQLSSSSLTISGLYYKTFRIVIYDGNDSTIVEPVL
jgi:hypothetical protein